jgi:UDP-2,4-diacetamido-2,4,6-trideoxy-beta-L-altropyranose hydrolase
LKRKIIFRADGSPSIGYGHVNRCLSLISILHEEFDCVFVSHNTIPFLADRLESLGIPLLLVSEIRYPSADARGKDEEVPFDMTGIIQGNEIVVLDGYWFGPQFQRAIKQTGVKLVYIDDLAAFEQVADVVINQSPGLSESAYVNLIAKKTKLFVGPAYSTVKVPDRIRHRAKSFESFSRLLICMGGADPMNFTTALLRQHEALIARYREVIVLLGAGFQMYQQVELAISTSNTRVEINLPKDDVYDLMAWASSAILPASTMAVEYAHVGGLLAIVQTAGNQKYFYKGLLDLDCAVVPERLTSFDSEAFEKMFFAQRRIFDGRSDERLLKIFHTIDRAA